jgi:hypothetical protein
MLAIDVLSVVPPIARSVLPLPKGMLARMDRTCRAMLWIVVIASSGVDY